MSNDQLLDEVDAALLAATGDPYGSPPDVCAWLRYALGNRSLSEFLAQASETDLEEAHVLMTAAAMDGSLQLSSRSPEALDESLRFGTCANRVAQKLTQVSGQQWSGLQIPAHYQTV